METSAPFFIRPIASSIVSRVKSFFLAPNFETHYKFLEEQLATSPGEGDYLCGRDLSSADIMMSFPLEAGKSRSGKTQVEYPRVWAYVERLHQREAYKRSVAKIEQMAGSFKTNL